LKQTKEKFSSRQPVFIGMMAFGVEYQRMYLLTRMIENLLRCPPNLVYHTFVFCETTLDKKKYVFKTQLIDYKEKSSQELYSFSFFDITSFITAVAQTTIKG
jgi:hypothetical protein